MIKSTEFSFIIKRIFTFFSADNSVSVKIQTNIIGRMPLCMEEQNIHQPVLANAPNLLAPWKSLSNSIRILVIDCNQQILYELLNISS